MLLVWKQAQFDDASNYMAAELDCTYLSRETADAELRRVLNVTEEMAVAAESPHRLFSSGRPIQSMPSPSGAGRSRRRTDSEWRHGDQRAVGQPPVRLQGGATRRDIPDGAAHVLVKPLPKKLQGAVGGILGLPWIFTGMLPALLLACVSAPSALCAHPMQLLVGRQRKFLADACAVQFTRNAPALRTVLARTRSQASLERTPRRQIDKSRR